MAENVARAKNIENVESAWALRLTAIANLLIMFSVDSACTDLERDIVGGERVCVCLFFFYYLFFFQLFNFTGLILDFQYNVTKILKKIN